MKLTPKLSLPLFAESPHVFQMQCTLRGRINLHIGSDPAKAKQRLHRLKRVPAPGCPRNSASHEKRVRPAVLGSVGKQRAGRQRFGEAEELQSQPMNPRSFYSAIEGLVSVRSRGTN